MSDEKVVVENVNHPGRTERVAANKYNAMKKAMLDVLPAGAPGITVANLQDGVKPLLPQELFPGGKTAGWWVKCVQLDLEAKKVIAREEGSPVRLYLL